MATNTDAPFVISRRDAKARSLSWYFEKPCIHGHVSKRTTSSKKCLECHRLARADLRHADPERIKTQKASYYQQNRDKVIASVAAYTEANREKVSQRRKRHREANKDQIAERMKVWSKANRHILRVHERNRRDRKRGAEGKHTLADIETLYKRQKGRCANPSCGVSIRDGYHIDHVQPIARGGSNWPQNLQLLCQPCNQSKHARDPIEWAQSLGRLL